MKLIIENVDQVEFVTEAKGDKKNLYIEGIFLQGAIKNRNGRMYPMPVLEKEVSRYMAENAAKGRGYGELGHPATPNINLDRVCILAKECKLDGTNYIGKAQVTSSPMGKILSSLIEDGATPGVSSRGVGTLKPNKEGIMEVQNDFRLAALVDVVADPSAPDAYVRGIMEGVEYWYDIGRGTWVEENMHETKKEIKGLSKSQLEEKKLKMFESFMANVAKL